MSLYRDNSGSAFPVGKMAAGSTKAHRSIRQMERRSSMYCAKSCRGWFRSNRGGGKIVRANAVTAVVEAGNVFYLTHQLPLWVHVILWKNTRFLPNGSNDDQGGCRSHRQTPITIKLFFQHGRSDLRRRQNEKQRRSGFVPIRRFSGCAAQGIAWRAVFMIVVCWIPDWDLAEKHQHNGLFSKIIDRPAEEALKTWNRV